MRNSGAWRHAAAGCAAGFSMLGGYLALELPVPQRVQNHVTNLVEDQRARNYKRWRPKRIILLRHGQTHGYVHTCDCEIDGVPVCASKPEHDRPLTDKGFEQALLAGNELKALIGDEKTRFLVSPYRACKQTFDCVSVPFDPTKCNFREEPRVRNQDLGPWWERMDANEIVRKKDEIRREAGNFYFRWPGGESCADVYDRVSQLLESLHKEWERPHADNYVLVSHTGVHCARARAGGCLAWLLQTLPAPLCLSHTDQRTEWALRAPLSPAVTCQILLMKWFHWDVATFEKLDKFRTGQFVVMERQENGRYKITNEIFTQHALARTTTLKKDFVGERDLNVRRASLRRVSAVASPHPCTPAPPAHCYCEHTGHTRVAAKVGLGGEGGLHGARSGRRAREPGSPGGNWA